MKPIAAAIDQSGCTPGQQVNNEVFVDILYSVINNGQDDFIPELTGFTGQAECNKPAIYDFLHLDGLFEEGLSLSKYATCVIDDNLLASSGGGNPCDHVPDTSSMKIGSFSSYGNDYEVHVSYKLTERFQNILNSPAKIYQLDLHVNPFISNGNHARAADVILCDKLPNYSWDTANEYPTVDVYSQDHDKEYALIMYVHMQASKVSTARTFILSLRSCSFSCIICR